MYVWVCNVKIEMCSELQILDGICASQLMCAASECSQEPSVSHIKFIYRYVYSYGYVLKHIYLDWHEDIVSNSVYVYFEWHHTCMMAFAIYPSGSVHFIMQSIHTPHNSHKGYWYLKSASYHIERSSSFWGYARGSYVQIRAHTSSLNDSQFWMNIGFICATRIYQD